jgi:hypothetical protein
LVAVAVAIVRVPDDICDEESDDDDGEPADDALNADCARNAARKFARKGRFVDIFLLLSLLFSSPLISR